MARYPVYRPRSQQRSSGARLLMWVAVLAVVGGGGWWIYTRVTSDDPVDDGPGAAEDQRQVDQRPPNRAGAPADRPPTGIEPLPDAPRPAPRHDPRAQEIYDRGMKLLADKRPIEARKLLSAAVLDRTLTPALDENARLALTSLADKMVFSPRVYDGDPYAMQYTFRSRDVLQNVERKLKLHVPYQGLLKINNIADARRIRAGQTVKLIKGPFHAIVYKSLHVMDLYLHREGMDRVFIRRLPVGLGRNGLTPEGSWRLANRLYHDKYYPAANSPNRTPVAYGREGYAFGHKGLWLGLEGTDDKTRQMRSYGIHSTNDPASIGLDASEGCIRMGDDGIDLVWALLYRKHSTVRILP